MHSLIHTDYAKAVGQSRIRDRRTTDPQRPEPPPNRVVRSTVAALLGAAAGRLDRDAARRAVA